MAIIDCSFITERDRVWVYDRGGDMKMSAQWHEATDFENDLWVFDAAADGRPELVIDFHHGPEGLIADLWDDQNGDGQVSYLAWPSLQVVESKWPTVKVVAPEGWWIRKEKINFNLDVQVDGWVFAAFAAHLYLDRLTHDGHIDFEIQVRDTDQDGRPDYQITQVTPLVPESWGIHRTQIMANPYDDELPITNSVFWPLLGSMFGPLGYSRGETQPTIALVYAEEHPYGIVKPYDQSFPPLQVSWPDAKIGYVGEFVASRGNDHNWFIYSINRLDAQATVEANFEAPFAFYDLAQDQDRHPELQIRVVHHPAFDPYMDNIVKSPLPFPFQNIRYSWDQDNDTTWDYKIDTIGHYLAKDDIHISDLAFLSFSPERLPEWVVTSRWDAVTFVAAETPYWTTEGIYTWPASDIRDYYLSADNSVLSEACGDIEQGFRGEYRIKEDEQPWLYFSAIDYRLHLLFAKAGVWNVDGQTEIRYDNLDGDAHIDEWLMLKDGKPIRQINWAAGHLVYAKDDQISLRPFQSALSLFETLPPKNHGEWLTLGQRLRSYEPQFSAQDFDAMLAQSGEVTWRVENAQMSDFRPGDGGYRFALELEPGFRVNGSGGPDLGSLHPGTYIVDYDGAFDIRPFDPARPEIVAGSFRLSQVDPIAFEPTWIEATLFNAGLGDLPHLWVQAYAETPGSAPEFIAETEVRLLAERAEPVRLPWTPPAQGDYAIHLVWGQDREALPASALGREVLRVGMAAPQPLEPGAIWRLSNTSSPAALVVFLAALGLGAALLVLGSLRGIERYSP
ncbi:MAG: hypothetical protein JXM73_11315 [Anaerolineae bacterium]|nr:hypothetical protein [Anaerolineae bacterium]